MALFVVVRHPEAASQQGTNRWLDDHRVKSIETSQKIGQRCQEARRAGDWVYVHRAGHGSGKSRVEPLVCCRVRVEGVTSLSPTRCQVRFEGWEVLDQEPPRKPDRGQSFYEADV